jgi:hypothetical protein
MLNHIALSGYDDDKYEATKEYYIKKYNRYSAPGKPADKTVRNYIMTFKEEEFDEETMDKLLMLITGMLWTIERGGIADDDPEHLAYNAWYALKDFSTGEFDDLFTPEDLILIKQDVKTLFDYFDEHPSLKGD